LKVLAFGEIMDGGASVFSSVAKVDADLLIVSFGGSIRIDNPYRYLEQYLLELEQLLPQEKIARIEFDFKELDFCNSNGFYIIIALTLNNCLFDIGYHLRIHGIELFRPIESYPSYTIFN